MRRPGAAAAAADTEPAGPLTRPPQGRRSRRARRSPSPLFWRTFGLLALLLATALAPLTWLLSQERARSDAVAAEPGALAILAAGHALSAVTTPVQRDALVARLAEHGVRLRLRDDLAAPSAAGRVPSDAALALQNALSRRVGHRPLTRDGPARDGGPWVALDAGGRSWWIAVGPPSRGHAERLWTGVALLGIVLALAAAVPVARRLNRPLRELQFATSRIREGDLDSRLDERVGAVEVREVNIEVNRMAKTLAAIERERAVMLAGISHDLRTPLARLRLETEMSVADRAARDAMAADIDQLDGIIGKFMEYARPSTATLRPLGLAAIVNRAMMPWRGSTSLGARVRLSPELRVLADDVELGRVFANLIENALRHGRTSPGGIAEIEIDAARDHDGFVRCVFRDRGPGVPADRLPRLTTPFFRGDDARTEVRGVGLGLSVVERSMQRMSGRVEIANAAGGGLAVTLMLPAAR